MGSPVFKERKTACQETLKLVLLTVILYCLSLGGGCISSYCQSAGSARSISLTSKDKDGCDKYHESHQPCQLWCFLWHRLTSHWGKYLYSWDFLFCLIIFTLFNFSRQTHGISILKDVRIKFLKATWKQTLQENYA